MTESSDVTVCDVEREPDPSDSLRTFGAVVQALREHAWLSRVDFGERVQFSKHTVESAELGRRMPDAAFVERAEEALGNMGALLKAAGHLTRAETGLATCLEERRRFGNSPMMPPVLRIGVPGMAHAIVVLHSQRFPPKAVGRGDAPPFRCCE